MHSPWKKRLPHAYSPSKVTSLIAYRLALRPDVLHWVNTFCLKTNSPGRLQCSTAQQGALAYSPCRVSSSLAHELHRHTHLHLLQCQENKRATMDPAWLSVSVLRKVRRLSFQLRDLLASQKTLAEKRVTAKTKKCSNCVKLATVLTLGHQPNVVAFMAICIALPKRICSLVYRCTNKVLVSLPLAV